MNVKSKGAAKRSSTKAKGSASTSKKNTSTKAKAKSTKNKASASASNVIDPDGAVATKILKALAKSKKGKTANELGTTPAIMQALEKAGKVKRNGTKPTGQRGRPPILWVVK